ncbi:MAG: hypothetical protein ACFFD6_11690 [Candidatus Thorarchaeota archaeon]
MSHSDKRVVKTQTIHPTWVPLLQSLYWEGKLKILLSKGFVFLQFSGEEKKQWNLGMEDINRIEETLQRNIEELGRKSPELRRKVLNILAEASSIEIPNYVVRDDTDLFHELTDASQEISQSIMEETQVFAPLIRKSEYEQLELAYAKWSRRNHFPAMKISASGISDILREVGFFHPELSFDDWNKLPIDICRFLLLVRFYYETKPSIERMALFKKLLLKKDETLTHTLDFIIFSSWRTHPDEMFTLTKGWIETGDAYLVDWLIHGVEVPGRAHPAKALRFLKPVVSIDSEDLEWITKHVFAQIIGASPHESLSILSKWIDEKEIRDRTQNIVEQALREVVEDKIETGNLMDEDYPDLRKTLKSILQDWSENGNELQQEVATDTISIL